MRFYEHITQCCILLVLCANIPYFHATSTTYDSILRLVLMSDKIKNGAVCLDGSPGAFYISQPVESNTQWTIFFEGGGWCFTEKDCLSTLNSNNGFGSSTRYPAIMKRTGMYSGILGSDPVLNPDFAEANTVVIKYCDGNSFSGNRDSALNTTGTPLYLRGRRILDSVLSTLFEKYGLGNATDVLLAGCSSGGLAAYLHADYVGEVLKKRIPSTLQRYKVAPISGFFLDHDNIANKSIYSHQMRMVFKLSNATYNLNNKCIASKTEENHWQCNMAPYVLPFITTPIMGINSALDTFQVSCILAAESTAGKGNFNCSARSEFPPDCACWECPIENTCTAENFVSFRNYENDFMASFNKSGVPLKLGNGAFIHSCYTHCAGSRDDYYNTLTINGRTIQQAISLWWNDDGINHNYAPCQVQGPGQEECNPTCNANFTRTESPTTSPSIECTTTDGNVPDGTSCVFPFVYDNVIYYNCTDVDNWYQDYWCSTTGAYHGSWGYCSCTTASEKRGKGKGKGNGNGKKISLKKEFIIVLILGGATAFSVITCCLYKALKSKWTDTNQNQYTSL